MPSLFPRLSAVCLSLVALAACAPEPAPPRREPVVHSLVEELPSAELHWEAAAIDFGTAEAQGALREGWRLSSQGPAEEDGPGSAAIWSEGRRSVLEFWLAAPRALRAEMRCEPAEPPDGRPQSISIVLNGRPAGELTLRPGLHDYVLDLPREALVAGRNRLAFVYRRTLRVKQYRPAVAWDLLRLTPGPPAAAELPRAEAHPGSRTPALLLPLGTEAAYYFTLEEGGTLSLQGVRGQGQGAGALQVIAQEEGRPETVLDTLRDGAGPQSLELPGRGARLVRLALRAVPDAAAAPGGLLLLEPAVRGIRQMAADKNAAAPHEKTSRPNILIYLVDTLRADRVGPYRSGPSITPEIDAFAESATVFENAVAQAPWTKPSVTSIFTGLGPLVHGVQHPHDKLPPEAVTAAELLHAGGYQTAGFSTNWHICRETGLDQGFGFFDFMPGEASSNLLNQHVLQWLDARAKPPFFLYVHSLDPHSPYTPPSEYREKFAPGISPESGDHDNLRRIWKAHGKERRRLMADIPPLYDAEVAFNDHSFGELLGALRRQGFYDDTLIVFVADHGEEFDEHGDFGHGANLHRETLDVPLIVKWPGQRRGQRAAALAQHVDLLPTLLRAAGLPVPGRLPGMDLAQVAASGESPEGATARWAISHLSLRSRQGISVMNAGWKLIHPLTPELAETSLLYRRSDDRAERTNRLEDFPLRAGWLESLIRLEQNRGKSGLKVQRYEMDEETRKALKALGYL